MATAGAMPPPHPGLPPAFPGFKYGNQRYAIAQELRTVNLTQAYATQRCHLLAASAVATIEEIGFSLVDPSPCEGRSDVSVLSCTFKGPPETIRSFVDWVSTSPLDVPTDACVPMTIAYSKQIVYNYNPSPPEPPTLPSPPTPPPRPLPSPPPPPPSPPPCPPHEPSPPLSPPLRPVQPPIPPESPPTPPSSPSTVQIASQPLCHPTCVSWAIADASDNPETDQVSSCAGFYANLCAYGTRLGVSNPFLSNPVLSKPPFITSMFESLFLTQMRLVLLVLSQYRRLPLHRPFLHCPP